MVCPNEGSENSLEFCEQKLYGSFVGCLFLVNPIVVVYNLAQFLSNPCGAHWCRFGSFVSWASKKQVCVALSSCESEYVSLTLAAVAAIYLQDLLTFFCLMMVDMPVLFCVDNQGALAQASNPVAHKQAKHIKPLRPSIRQLVEDKRIQLSYVSTKNNLADIFTKNQPKPAFNQLSSQLFIIHSSQSSFSPLPPPQLNYFTLHTNMFML